MPAVNKEAMMRVRALVNRRYVDTSLLNIHVIGGTVHFTGVLRHLRNYPDIDLRAEMEHITHILRQQPGLREVIWDVTVRD
ncbi:MAG TPA: hypothetical protein VKV29_10325 [Chthonomonas sp.]|jgi:hypothetical protein|uniref:hypothetical protein n=1 Tax=Chthonomonas sp. TaxID=2282153 RepID=UPI002B4AB840|nr:hypothetical protein [Chthonomonas sp.]HLH80662.1 hypothetical protein [Chthonomonas sp.]